MPYLSNYGEKGKIFREQSFKDCGHATEPRAHLNRNKLLLNGCFSFHVVALNSWILPFANSSVLMILMDDNLLKHCSRLIKSCWRDEPKSQRAKATMTREIWKLVSAHVWPWLSCLRRVMPAAVALLRQGQRRAGMGRLHPASIATYSIRTSRLFIFTTWLSCLLLSYRNIFSALSSKPLESLCVSTHTALWWTLVIVTPLTKIRYISIKFGCIVTRRSQRCTALECVSPLRKGVGGRPSTEQLWVVYMRAVAHRLPKWRHKSEWEQGMCCFFFFFFLKKTKKWIMFKS